MTSEERRKARYLRRKQHREEQRQKRFAACGTLEEIFSFEHLYKSYKLCCSGVGWKSSVQAYKANALVNIYKARAAILDGTYRSRGFIEFDIVERGKPRHIRSVHISERVVQRCLCDYALVPLLSARFIHDNGASLRGKGIDFSLDRLNHHLRCAAKMFGNSGYVLTFDFSKFFDNAQHGTIFAEYAKALPPQVAAWAMYFVRQFGDSGLGLGSQVSQISALALPNSLDHFIKEELGITCYARYMDDGYIGYQNKEYLRYCMDALKAKCNELGIKLNPKKTQIRKLNGMTFLKTRFIVTETGKVIRVLNHKSITRMRRKLRIFRRWVDEGRMTVADANNSYQSWRGHARRCNTRRALKKMDDYFKELFGGNEKVFKVIKDDAVLCVEDYARYVKLQTNGVYIPCSETEADGIIANDEIHALNSVQLIEFNGPVSLAAAVSEGATLAQASAEVPPATIGVLSDGFGEWQPGVTYEKQYSLFTYGGKVGFTRQAGITAQAHQPPFSTGMESVYGVRPVPDDLGVYPYEYNMAASVGMKVREGSDTYICIQAIDVMLYPPSQLAAHFTKL